MKVSAVVIALCLVFLYAAAERNPHPSHSFRPPYSTGRVGIRGWNYGGDVTIYQDFVRLTQDAQSKIGYIWNRNALTFNDWEATLSVKIDGKGRLGGDGIAFWYAAQSNTVGKAFGAPEKWKGLGVFIDTFDNDNKHDNPLISVIVNDGTMVYNPQTDGQDLQIGGCRAAFRKTSGSPSLRVTYRGSIKELKVQYDLTGSNKWQDCFTGSVDLPTGYYLGISAATGGVSDNHDINYFELRRLDGAGDFGNDNTYFNGNPNNARQQKQQKQQEEKNAKEMDSLKQDLDALRRVNAEEKKEKGDAKPTKLADDDIQGRLTLIEDQFDQMENKLSAISKVAEKIDVISSSVDLLKQRIDNQPASSLDANQLKNELARQQQEINRITSSSQDKINSVVNNRVSGIEKSLKDLQARIDEMALQSKKTGGSFLNIIMIIVMVAESCLLLVMFMKGRQTNKYDKMW